MYTRNIKLDAEDCSDVVNPLLPSLVLGHSKGAGNEVLFLVLDLQHLHLDGVIREKLVDEDISGLAEAVNAVEALPLAGGVPGGVQQQQMAGGSQVQSYSACLQTAIEDLSVECKARTSMADSLKTQDCELSWIAEPEHFINQ